MNKLFVHDMVHNNPGLETYETAYNDPGFLKERGYDGKVYHLFDSAAFGLTWERLNQAHPEKEKVFPEGSQEIKWVENKSADLKQKYVSAAKTGLGVYFMMDIIVLPKRIIKLYPEILNEEGKIDICTERMQEIIGYMFDEMFEKFPEIAGIYIRYGETYVGNRYNTPYHCGNNPIQGNEIDYHKKLISMLIDEVCIKHKRQIFYRTWGFGAFQFDPEFYLEVSSMIPPHPLFYFCIKHTAGDFHRTFPFNQCLNIGAHQQVVEVQAAREYEGKGAYPNYIAGGVIHGFTELEWVMQPGQTKCLMDVAAQDDSLIKGLWTWSRGGGWDGPYIMGKNGVNGEIIVEDGSELWCDVSAYVLTCWAKDMSHPADFYVKQYAQKELGMKEADAEIFLKIQNLSSQAVLLGRGTNLPGLDWNVFWTRDQNINYDYLMDNIESAYQKGILEEMLAEKKESVRIWQGIAALAQSLDEKTETRNYIVTTCKYGLYLYSIYETMYRGNARAYYGGSREEVNEAVRDYDALWESWNNLYETEKGCPTLYEKKPQILDLIGYVGNTGFDYAMNRLRMEV